MKKLRIGITGQAGFIGTHLFNTLGLYPDLYERISFKDDYFQTDEALDAFVRQCDVIVHLAAMNRHHDPDVLYKTNIELVQKLIDAMERTNCMPFVILSSSLQEERDNLYGRSKREGRELFNMWADRNDAAFTGLIIPNVFGPFGVPFYNSVISTFSYQIANGLEPKIEIDAELKLIYVGDLIKIVIGLFPAGTADCGADAADNSQCSFHGSQLHKPERLIHVDHLAVYKVTELLCKINGFHQRYGIDGVFPDLRDRFEMCLFNTYRSYLPIDLFPVLYKKHSDNRGDFVEVMKYLSGGQTSYSTTKPGITRGNHYHTRKVERFAVIKGIASIKLRKYGSDVVIEYIINGDDPAYVDMPVWYTHNITNIGETELVTLFWINELFDPSDPDTYFEEV